MSGLANSDLLAFGSQLPDFLATRHDGGSLASREMRGHWFVLWWFPKADTPGCTTEAMAFRDLAADYETRGIVVLGASFDQPEELSAFASRHGLTCVLLSDPERELATLTRARRPETDPHSGYPRRITYAVDPNGRVAATYEVTDPAGHPQELLRDLDTLMANR